MTDHMRRPQWKWELSPNSIGIVFVIIGTIVGWGVILGTYGSVQSDHAETIKEMQADIRQIDQSQQQIRIHDIRITRLEQHAENFLDMMRRVEQTLNDLKSDLRLLVQRMEQRERRLDAEQAPFRQGAQP